MIGHAPPFDSIELDNDECAHSTVVMTDYVTIT